MSDQLVIRTMKDDVAGAQSAPATPAAPSVPPIRAPRHEKQEAPVFSLPVQKQIVSLKDEGETVTTPNKKRHHVITGILYIVLFFVLVGGGVYAYMRFGAAVPLIEDQEEQLTINQVIPKEFFAIADYNLGSEEKRAAVGKMWSGATIQSSDPATGNPSSLLAISDIGHVYYVVLPGLQQPFLLLKKTVESEQYVATQRREKPFEKGGWYIINSQGIEEYTAALQRGTLEDGSAALASDSDSEYVIQYAVSSQAIAEEFTSITSSLLSSSGMQGLVFRVVEASENGIMAASAHIPGPAKPDTVTIGTEELVSLIPGDINFAKVGLQLNRDLISWQEDVALLDDITIEQPSVRQFLSLLNAPYAVFERTGSDGVRDIGVIVQLPSSLQKNLKTGEPVVEQALTAIIPLIVGKTLGIQIVFNDAAYQNVPLRYVNLNGQTQALDYVAGDNFLLVASSREGLYRLIDASLGSGQTLLQSDMWGTLFSSVAAGLDGKPFVLGKIKNPAITSILPVVGATQEAYLTLSASETSTGTDIHAIVSGK